MNIKVDQFANYVAAHHDAIWVESDHEKANQLALKIDSLFKQIAESGTEGRDSLKRLFFDTRPAVRVVTATYLFRHCEKDSFAVPRPESSRGGITSFEASQSIDRWMDKSWALDLE